MIERRSEGGFVGGVMWIETLENDVVMRRRLLDVETGEILDDAWRDEDGVVRSYSVSHRTPAVVDRRSPRGPDGGAGGRPEPAGRPPASVGTRDFSRSARIPARRRKVKPLRGVLRASDDRGRPLSWPG
jgi:hypothetical protein